MNNLKELENGSIEIKIRAVEWVYNPSKTRRILLKLGVK